MQSLVSLIRTASQAAPPFASENEHCYLVNSLCVLSRSYLRWIICIFAVYDMTGLSRCQWQMRGRTVMDLSSLSPQWLLLGWTTSIQFLVELWREWMLYRYSWICVCSHCYSVVYLLTHACTDTQRHKINFPWCTTFFLFSFWFFGFFFLHKTWLLCFIHGMILVPLAAYIS